MMNFLKKNIGIIVIVVIAAGSAAGFYVKMSLQDNSDINVESLSRETGQAFTADPEDPYNDVNDYNDNTNSSNVGDDKNDDKPTINPDIYNDDGTIDVYIDGEISVTELPDSKITGPATDIELNADDRAVLVNKLYPMDDEYKPDDLRDVEVDFGISYADEKKMLREEAASALECMFASAKKSGYELIGVSGFRSFTRQKTIYNNNLVYKGYEHTNKYSARPGRSEHQTGWAIDISCESVDGNLTSGFIDTQEGQWVKANCFRFGFIVRYPKDKEKITGYSYEPWHIRYVGYDLARYLYENNLTLDEYYGYEADLEQIEQEEKEYYDELMGIGYEPTYVPMDEPTIDVSDYPEEPVTEEPATEEPTKPQNTEEPKPTKEPQTQKPSQTPKPSTTKPATTKPVDEEPVTDKPSTEKPASEEPGLTTKPVTTKPVTTKPSTTRPSTDKPVTTKPSTTKPATTKPATTKPSTTKPASEKPEEGEQDS